MLSDTVKGWAKELGHASKGMPNLKEMHKGLARNKKHELAKKIKIEKFNVNKKMVNKDEEGRPTRDADVERD